MGPRPRIELAQGDLREVTRAPATTAGDDDPGAAGQAHEREQVGGVGRVVQDQDQTGLREQPGDPPAGGLGRARCAVQLADLLGEEAEQRVQRGWVVGLRVTVEPGDEDVVDGGRVDEPLRHRQGEGRLAHTGHAGDERRAAGHDGPFDLLVTSHEALGAGEAPPDLDGSTTGPARRGGQGGPPPPGARLGDAERADDLQREVDVDASSSVPEAVVGGAPGEPCLDDRHPREVRAAVTLRAISVKDGDPAQARSATSDSTMSPGAAWRGGNGISSLP